MTGKQSSSFPNKKALGVRAVDEALEFAMESASVVQEIIHHGNHIRASNGRSER